MSLLHKFLKSKSGLFKFRPTFFLHIDNYCIDCNLHVHTAYVQCFGQDRRGRTTGPIGPKIFFCSVNGPF